MWHIVSLIGDVFLLLGLLMFYVTFTFELATAEAFIGIGTFLTWFSSTYYLTTLPKYSTIWRTIVHAAPLFVRTLLGVLPVLIGTALLFYVLFYKNFVFFGSYSKA
jgi:hypothetical protein